TMNDYCYKSASYAHTNFTVATTVNPAFGALPHYRISPPTSSPSAFMINPTKMFIKVDAANYTLYQVVRVNNSWTYAEVMDIASTDFDVNGFVFIDRKFNEITSDVYIVMVPVGTDMSGVTVDETGAYNNLGSGSTDNSGGGDSGGSTGGGDSGGSTGGTGASVLNLD
ncbi:hypothetical protein UB34_20980, partial [Photobacterium leiognathi]|uniref:hypothetical protein n=1 Tax=Photobacterium leiognathi TaxID=553611 RepID=UPI0005D3D122